MDDVVVNKSIVIRVMHYVGDFNEVKVPEDGFNSVFDPNNAMVFNEFISNVGLLEYNMVGRLYTYLSADDTKLSKINQVFVCDGYKNLWPDALLVA